MKKGTIRQTLHHHYIAFLTPKTNPQRDKAGLVTYYRSLFGLSGTHTLGVFSEQRPVELYRQITRNSNTRDYDHQPDTGIFRINFRLGER